jgi:sodium pump decarboxylase gamma subunit
MNIDWGVAGNVVFSGLIIVFFVLVMLILLVTLMGKALSRGKAAPPPAPASAAVPAAPRPVVVPQAAAGDSGEVIAVISAAVSAYMEETAPGTAYAITGIHPRPGRTKDTRPAWGFAGMRQNTEPF